MPKSWRRSLTLIPLCIPFYCILGIVPYARNFNEDMPSYTIVQSYALNQKTNGINGRLLLLMDERFTPDIRERLWGIAEWRWILPPSSELFSDLSSLPPGNARVEIRNDLDKTIAVRTINKPLAKLKKLASANGANADYYLLSVDYSTEAGSYNGPATTLFKVLNAEFTIW